MREDALKFSINDVPEFAILIKRTANGGTHTGILCRLNGRLHVIDQTWHERFRVAEATADDPCVVPSLLPEEIRDLTANCRHFVDRRNRGEPGQRLPYGFTQPRNPSITRDGEILWDEGVGLTCSTFVLAMFEAARVPWVDLSGWRRREGDDARHLELLSMMREGVEEFAIEPASAAHIENVEKQLPCIRVRPEEAAAPGLSEHLPLGFEEAERLGGWILEKLTVHG